MVENQCINTSSQGKVKVQKTKRKSKNATTWWGFVKKSGKLLVLQALHANKQNFVDFRVGNFVLQNFAKANGAHNSAISQNAQLVGNGSLVHLRYFGKVGHAQRRNCQCRKNFQPRRVGKQRKKRRHLLQRNAVRHVVVHVFQNLWRCNQHVVLLSSVACTFLLWKLYNKFFAERWCIL